MSETVPEFLWTLFKQLRRRQFPIGVDDFEALRNALKAGFGWSSREELGELCCTLWAKSKREQDILETLFDQLEIFTWQLPKIDDAVLPSPDTQPNIGDTAGQDTTQSVSVAEAQGGLPPISLDGIELPQHHFIFVPQFPLTYREVAQAWRRLRQPVREGPPTELDVEATIDRRSRLGVISEIVLVPRRRNMTRLLLLVDRGGSMTPFHDFVDEVCDAIQQASNLENVALYYFHDTPVESADETLLETVSNDLFPTLDPILPEIMPLAEGFVYDDPDFLSPQALEGVLQTYATGAAVVFLSDAGAARGDYDLLRLLDTIAFLKALRTYTTRYVWLNPMLKTHWQNSTAGQIARHSPMLPLNQAGIYQAVNILRGQPHLFVEKPI